jgi:DNA-binding CsgD family transcriptional regulator
MNDRASLAKCAQPQALDFAFRSGQPNWIGAVSAAFAQLCAAEGRPQEAEDLLGRALTAVGDRLLGGCELSTAVARFGRKDDVARARIALARRPSGAHPRPTQATLHLIDAFTEKRWGDESRARNFAEEAMHGFDAIGYRGLSDVARKILNPNFERKPGNSSANSAFPLLTEREKEVAELVLLGRTNREIAETLQIKERTVETHMTAIMERMGIRSRHQLRALENELKF